MNRPCFFAAAVLLAGLAAWPLCRLRSTADAARSERAAAGRSTEISAFDFAAAVDPLPQDAAQRGEWARQFAQLARLHSGPALEYLRSLGADPERDRLLMLAVRELARSDPRLAAEVALVLSDEKCRLGALRIAISGLADQGVEQALDWATVHIPPGSLRDAGLVVICSRLAETEPDLAIALAGVLPPGSVPESVFNGAAAVWARQDPGAALDWLEQLADGPTKLKLTATVGAELMGSDLASAVDLARALPQSDEQNELVQGIARAWTVQDPAAAAAWVQNFPEGLARQRAIREVAREWAQSDPTAAGGWISTLPAGESRDEALWAYSLALGPSQADSARAWAAKIVDGERRSFALGAIAR